MASLIESRAGEARRRTSQQTGGGPSPRDGISRLPPPCQSGRRVTLAAECRPALLPRGEPVIWSRRGVAYGRRCEDRIAALGLSSHCIPLMAKVDWSDRSISARIKSDLSPEQMHILKTIGQQIGCGC